MQSPDHQKNILAYLVRLDPPLPDWQSILARLSEALFCPAYVDIYRWTSRAFGTYKGDTRYARIIELASSGKEELDIEALADILSHQPDYLSVDESIKQLVESKKCSNLSTCIAPGMSHEQMNKAIFEAQTANAALECTKPIDIHDVIMESLMDFEKYYITDQDKYMPGMQTGFRFFDDFGGLSKDNFVVVAGAPSNGKTGFGLQLAMNLMRSKHGVQIISAEMSPKQITDRMLMNSSNISKEQMLAKQKVCNLNNGVNELLSFNFKIYECDDLFIEAIESEVVRNKSTIDVFIIDYYQKIKKSGKVRGKADLQDLEYISDRLRLLCKNHQVCIILLAQRRAQDRSSGPSYTTDDISDCKEPGKDAQIFVILELHEADEVDGIIPMTAYLIKNREGAKNKKYPMILNGPIAEITGQMAKPKI
ncbi:MAG: DnaB-like helicase C-terminal domain-containing protein [Saezia sp.]